MKFKWVTNPESIDKSFIETEVKSGNNVIVQFDNLTYNDEILSNLNTLAGQLDNNLQIRFYGHNKKALDCKTLLKVKKRKKSFN